MTQAPPPYPGGRPPSPGGPPPHPGQPPQHPAAQAPYPGAPQSQHPGAAAPYPAPPLPRQTPAPGFTAPYTAPVHPGYGAALGAPAPSSRALGAVALTLGAVAALVTPIVAAVAAFPVGVRTAAGLPSGSSVEEFAAMSDWDWSLLTPVRDWVLLWEVSFWIGTALGVWALVQGIFAIVKRKGRGAGVAAIVLAALGPFIYGFVSWLSFAIGLGTGMGV